MDQCWVSRKGLCRHQKYTNIFKDKTPIIRSWCVELDVLKDVVPNSESESGIPNGKVLLNSNYALNSDQSSAPNQFLFKGESLKKIIANSIPKTYQSFKGEDVKVIAQEFGLYK